MGHFQKGELQVCRLKSVTHPKVQVLFPVLIVFAVARLFILKFETAFDGVLQVSQEIFGKVEWLPMN
jgi:hypothetical protein